MTLKIAVVIILTAVSAGFIGCKGPKSAAADTNTPASQADAQTSADTEPTLTEANQPAPLPAPSDVNSPAQDSADRQVTAAEPNAPADINAANALFDKCAPFLKTYVRENGMVDYKTLKRNRHDLRKLMDEFDALTPAQYDSWLPEDKIAMWINAYNLQMLNIMIQNYPIESSRINRLWFPPTSIRHIPGIWTDYKFLVMDEEFTLNEIERRFFRGEFDEPRVFFALSRASMSSPPLRNEPYYGKKLYEQLDDQIMKFLLDSQNFRVDRDSRTVYISAILEPVWVGKDLVKYQTDKKFKDREPVLTAVLNFISGYVSDQDKRFLELENYTVKFINYDWRLNE